MFCSSNAEERLADLLLFGNYKVIEIFILDGLREELLEMSVRRKENARGRERKFTPLRQRKVPRGTTAQTEGSVTGAPVPSLDTVVYPRWSDFRCGFNLIE